MVSGDCMDRRLFVWDLPVAFDRAGTGRGSDCQGDVGGDAALGGLGRCARPSGDDCDRRGLRHDEGDRISIPEIAQCAVPRGARGAWLFVE